jgi:hypothetical protein
MFEPYHFILGIPSCVFPTSTVLLPGQRICGRQVQPTSTAYATELGPEVGASQAAQPLRKDPLSILRSGQ